MASDKRLDQVKLVNSAESVLVVNGDQVEKATLAGFANSMGSSVPLQQTSEQVNITGLYARTSDGKMVELTKESVASVMGNLLYGATNASGLASVVAQQMGNPIGYKGDKSNTDANTITSSGLYYLNGGITNALEWSFLIVFSFGSGNDVVQINTHNSESLTKIRKRAGGTWSSWQTL